MGEAMTMIYVMLKQHVAEAQRCGNAIKKLQARSSKQKPTAS